MKAFILAAAFVVIFIACAPTTTNVGDGATTAADLELLKGWGWEHSEYGARYLVGTVRNNTDKSYGYVQITFALLDADGAQVGSTFTNVNDLQPHTDWRFRAGVLEGAARKAKVTEITGF